MPIFGALGGSDALAFDANESVVAVGIALAASGHTGVALADLIGSAGGVATATAAIFADADVVALGNLANLTIRTGKVIVAGIGWSALVIEALLIGLALAVGIALDIDDGATTVDAGGTLAAVGIALAGLGIRTAAAQRDHRAQREARDPRADMQAKGVEREV